MSVRKKFLGLKAIIKATRPTKRGCILNDLNVATNGLFFMTNKLRGMSAEQIKKISKDEGNGLVSISFSDLEGINKHKEKSC